MHGRSLFTRCIVVRPFIPIDSLTPIIPSSPSCCLFPSFPPPVDPFFRLRDLASLFLPLLPPILIPSTVSHHLASLPQPPHHWSTGGGGDSLDTKPEEALVVAVAVHYLFSSPLYFIPKKAVSCGSVSCRRAFLICSNSYVLAMSTASRHCCRQR